MMTARKGCIALHVYIVSTNSTVSFWEYIYHIPSLLGKLFTLATFECCILQRLTLKWIFLWKTLNRWQFIWLIHCSFDFTAVYPCLYNNMVRHQKLIMNCRGYTESRKWICRTVCVFQQNNASVHSFFPFFFILLPHFIWVYPGNSLH